MTFLDYTGLGYFLGKLKNIFVQTDTKGVANGVASLDSSGKVPSAQVPTPSVMTGATSSAAGAAGTVPAPIAGDDVKYLCGNGTWAAAATTTETQAIISEYGVST